MAFSQFKLDASENIGEIQKIIRLLESPLMEFMGMVETGHFPAPNVLFFKAHDEPVELKPIILEQVDPDLSQEDAGALVDKRIDQGFAPLSNFFDINLTRGEVTVLAYRSEQELPLDKDDENWIHTNATVFGLNMNGSYDEEDNGMGAPVLGSINTRNPSLVGAAIPIRLAKQIFGTLAGAKDQSIEVVHKANNRTIQAKIVDLGPSEGQVAKGIALDLTLGAQKALGGNGLIPVKYRFINS
jgi:hypothetical protein